MLPCQFTIFIYGGTNRIFQACLSFAFFVSLLAFFILKIKMICEGGKSLLTISFFTFFKCNTLKMNRCHGVFKFSLKIKACNMWSIVDNSAVGLEI